MNAWLISTDPGEECIDLYVIESMTVYNVNYPDKKTCLPAN